MTLKIFSYTLKVWLTSVLIAPISVVLLLLSNGAPTEKSFVDLLHPMFILYLSIVLFELTLTLIIWLIFWLTVHLIMISKIESKNRILWIFIAGLCLSIICCMPFLLESCSESLFVVPLMCNCFCIAMGIWLYRSDIVSI